MVSKNLPSIIILFNIIMFSLMFLSSQFILTALNGKIVQGANIFIDYTFPYYPMELAPPTVTAPLPNYPLFVFIYTLTVDCFFLIKLRNQN
jgi:hypothetical protein